MFKKYTGIFAISTNGVIGYEIYEKDGIKKVKDLIQEKNKLLYSVPYQHYTNAIENFFSVLKNKLRKCNGIGYK